MSSTSHRSAAVVWRKRLGAALRIVVACGIVGCSTLYGPAGFRQQVEYPAFAYVTAILIVSESTLGHTLAGSWHALISTFLVMGPSVATLWFVGPARFNAPLASLAVAIGAFGVALVESSPLLAKRLAFGQLVIVYVGAVVLGEKTDVVMHPIHVAASTGLGALASVLAMLIPFPMLAKYQVQRKCKLYIKNASERINLYIEAIVSKQNCGSELSPPMVQIKTLSEKASVLLRSIERKQDALLWESPLRLISTSNFKYPTAVLREVEMSLQAMEIALAPHPAYATKSETPLSEPQLKAELQRAANLLNSRIQKIDPSFLPFTDLTRLDPETNYQYQEEEHYSPILDPYYTTILKHLHVFFFFLCIKCLNKDPQLLDNNKLNLPTAKDTTLLKKEGHNRLRFRRIFLTLFPNLSNQNLVFASKCSLSLGLAVLFGLTYTKQNGCWSGLTIAISFVPSREATFTTINARAQGTALGSIYGVLGCFFLHRYGALKLLSLIPWIIFTTFLRHSKMYGEAGSTSAVIASLLIMGRRNYGTPTEFAIDRLTEAFIGLSCFIIVELLLQPKRAAMVARLQVESTIETIEQFFEQITLQFSQCNMDSNSLSIKQMKNEMEFQVESLKKLVEVAKKEPNFWFKPFQEDCYTTLLQSVMKISNILLFMACAVELLNLELHRPGVEWKCHTEQLSHDIMLFKRLIGSLIRCIRHPIMALNGASKEKEKVVKTNGQGDIEMGKVMMISRNGIRVSDIDIEGDVEIILESFLQHVIDLTQSSQIVDDHGLKKQLLISLGSTAFCMRSLVTETTEVAKVLNEVIRRENS